MAYVLEATAPIDQQIRRVVGETLDEAIERLDQIVGGTTDAETVDQHIHQVRKRTKEARAATRLVRRAIGRHYAQVNALVRDAAGELADFRDAHALLATVDKLIEVVGPSGELSALRAAQAARSAAATQSISGGDQRIARARYLLGEARDDVDQWRLSPGFSPAADGLADTYKRGRADWINARRAQTDHALHEWRKSAKRLWYQTRLLAESAPSVLHPMIEVLDSLGDALGDDHDLAVLIEQINADSDEFGGSDVQLHVVQLMRAAQQRLRQPAFRLGATLYAESAAAFTERLTMYTTCTLLLGVEQPVGGLAGFTGSFP